MIEEIKRRRLAAQHLLSPADTETVAKDLCGVQAQYLSHALHGLSLRCGHVDTENLAKSWTLRGTMHLFSQDDLPLFLHEGRGHFLREVDTLESDAYMDKNRKMLFAARILDAIASGTDTREGLKEVCRENGMSDSEEKSLFDPWGGIIRALCEDGKICHRVQQEKAYRLCPEFTPMDRESAHLELARRYFSHFGPATVKDAAYFLGWTQKEVKQQLSRLPVDTFTLQDTVYYHIPAPLPDASMPRILFLAGFDQLILGYEKKDSLFLPREHLRDIFTLSGIVRPALLVDGTVAGHWNLKNRVLSVTAFRPLDETVIRQVAAVQWPDLKQIEIK